MPRQQIVSAESFADLKFPLAGIDLSLAYGRQSPRKMLGREDWGMTTPEGVNVRAFEAATNRMRGGSREGLVKYISAQVASLAWVIQELNQVTVEGTPSGSMQTSASGRIVYLVAVSQGLPYWTTAGQSTWTASSNTTGSSPPLNATGIVRSAVNNLKLFFVDGINSRYWDPADQTIKTWTATAGTLPIDGSNNRPRLICTWRGRTVLSGVLEDPQNWFMSAVNDPFDYDYAPSSPSATDAVAGNLSPLGLIGDVVTGLCPYSDDVLMVFGDHSIYAIRGDPLGGGSVDLVSDIIGAAWGQAWCKDPYGSIWFVSNRMGIYTLTPGSGPPVRVSQQIEQIVGDVNTGANTIRLAWNDRFQGLHVFITPTANAAAGANAFHLFYEARTGGWWKDTFANRNHNPLCVLTYDGNLPTDRAVLLGSWDGYVRNFSTTATKDDGTAIASSVVFGPLLTKDLDAVLFKDMQAVLGADSGDVTYAVHEGATAELALESTAILTGTFAAGRNHTTPIRRRGYALWVKITSTNQWAMEAIRIRIEGKGKVARRGA